MSTVRVVAVIPARWGSRRFPGKALVRLREEPMIAWVVKAALGAGRVERTLVATDDARIAEAAAAAGAEVRMTRADHPTGTDRTWEAVSDLEADVVLNLQGDEPMLRPESVDRLAAAFDDPEVRMATLGVRGATERDREDPHRVKIVVDAAGNALYFSRASIPYRNLEAGAPEPGEDDREMECWQHVGSYGFRREALERFVAEPRGALERLEDLEQLRALELGWRIRVVEAREAALCVDVPQDVERVEAMMAARGEGFRSEGVAG